MTTTDLKPGDIVQHPEKGNGIINRRFARDDVGVMYADLDRDGISSFTFDPDGWERVETVRPGHVQVRVNDLDLSRWEGVFEGGGWNHATRVAIRAANAISAQRDESTPPADEQPTNATVTLFCPDCGEPITNTAMVEVNREGERYLDFCNVNVHTCPPAQPDEPTEFGARVTATRPDGTREKWLRSEANTNEAWRAENGSEIGWFSATTWDNVIERGTVTLGWDE